MSRLPEFDETKLTVAQKEVYDRIAAGPRGGVRGPFKALLHAPELGDLVQAVGGHLRYGGALSGDLRELAILVTGRHINAQYEFFAHARTVPGRCRRREGPGRMRVCPKKV